MKPGPDEPAPSSPGTVRTRAARHLPQEQLLFGGTYGLVLSSALIAALENPGEDPDPASDLLWVLLATAATAAAHGYAHVIARRAAARGETVRALRTMLAEWPLLAAALPTAVLLSVAAAGWWEESDAAAAALWFNTVALFAWGTWAARAAGRRWPGALLSGAVDLVFGLVIVFVDAVSHA